MFSDPPKPASPTEGYVVKDKRRIGHEEPEHDASETDAAPAADAATVQEQLKHAQDQSLRALAEYENTKKRLQREKEEFAKYAAETVIRERLPILDGLAQALVAVDKGSDPEAITKGVHLIYRQLLGVLEKEGVKRIATIGERFDPHLHEAVAHVPADAHQAEGTIVEEVHVGYTMHGKVIRPAMVKVAQQKADSVQRTADSHEEPRT